MALTGTSASPTFPTKNPLESFSGGQAAYVLRIDPFKSGSSSLAEGTILGGTNDSAQGHGLAIDAQGNLYVAGFSSSADFTTIDPAAGAYKGGSDGFVVKLAPSTSQANLKVTATATPEPVVQGSNLVYTITVTDNGPGAVGGVYLSNKLDTGTTFVSSNPAQRSLGNGSLVFALPGLANGASKQIQLTVRVDTPSFVTGNGTGQTLNTVTVIGDRPDSTQAAHRKKKS